MKSELELWVEEDMMSLGFNPSVPADIELYWEMMLS